MNRDFEKYIRKTLKDQEDYVDAEAIWQQVEPHVGLEKKRRRFFWWFFFGVMSGLMGAVIWMYTHEGSTLLEGQVTLSEVAADGAFAQSKAERQLIEEVVEDINVENDIENQESKNETVVSNNRANTQVISAEGEAEQSNNEKSQPTNSQTNELLTNRQISAYNNRNTMVAQTRETSASVEITMKEESTNESLSEFLQEDVYSPLDEEPLSLMAVDLLKKGEPDQFVIPEEIQNNSLTISSVLMANSLLAEVTSSKPLKEGLIPEAHKLIIPVHKQKKWKFAIGLYAGIGLVNDGFSAIGEDTDEGYLQSRKSSEIQLESSSFGASFTIKNKQRFSVRTGLEYHRIARRLNYEETTFDNDTISDAILRVYINNTNGDTLYDVGELINESSEVFEKEHFNYFHRLDVPILLGYHFNRRKFAIGVEVGVYANILLRKKGQVLDQRVERAFYDIDADSNSWYKTNIGFTPTAQLSIGYRISPKFELQASPYYRFRTTYSTSAALVEENYSDVGLQLGVKYWLR